MFSREHKPSQPVCRLHTVSSNQSCRHISYLFLNSLQDTKPPSMRLLQLSTAKVFTWHPMWLEHNLTTIFTTFCARSVQLGKFVNFGTPGRCPLLASFHCIFSFRGASFPNDLTHMAVCQRSQTPCTTLLMIYRGQTRYSKSSSEYSK